MSDNDGLTIKDLAGIGSTIGQVSLSAGHVLEVNGTLDLSRNSGALQLPVGTTAQRPTNKEPGYLRWNTDTNAEGTEIGLEYWDGYTWYPYGEYTARSGSTSSAATSYSALFDGSGDYLGIVGPTNGWNFASSEDWSLELFVKDAGTSPGTVLLDFYVNSGNVGKEQLLRLGNDLIFRTDASTAQLTWSNGWSSTISDGEWHYIVVNSHTAAGSTIWKMYVDGTEVASKNWGITKQSVKGDRLRIGYSSIGNAQNYFNGYISNVRVTNNSLYPSSNTTPISALTTTSQGATVSTVELLMLSLNAISPDVAAVTPGQITVAGNTVSDTTNPFGAGGGGGIGEAIFHADGPNSTKQYTWEVPDGIDKISVVSVGAGGGGEANHDGAGGGGGALSYKNNIAVSGGDQITVYVGGGGMCQGWGNYGPNGGDSYITHSSQTYAYAGGGTGGKGNYSSQCHNIPGGNNSNGDGGGNGGASSHYSGCRQAGGGAGGYNGGGQSNSGRVGNPSYSGCSSQAGQNGGGGGGSSANGSSSWYSNGGGGTGVYGQGSNGARGGASGNSYSNSEWDFCGKGGSSKHNTGLRGYSNRSSNSSFAGTGSGYNRYHPSYNSYNSYTCPDGGFPGGGAGGGNSGDAYGMGAHGMVRIVYGQVDGADRAFPDTNVDLSTQYDENATIEENGTQKMY